ncbi:MAG: tetratricopeptide repeat protein, partial [Saprospiraceae bacterium]|nr:tetratricopeptide repeat protein [Saprospiraceae bacterium]
MASNKKKKKKTRSSKRTVSPLDPQLIRRTWIGLCIVGFLCYANTLPHGFTQDDAIVITDNMYTQEGISGIPGLLTKDTFFGFFKTEGKSRLVSGGRYRPLTPIMFAVEYELFGQSPFVGHLINVLLYCLTGILIFQLLLWMGARTTWPDRAWQFAMIGAGLFLVHPLHTEVVSNIKGRDEIMSLLLSLTALWLVVRTYPKPSLKHLALAALAFFGALLSKENAITFLAVIPLSLVFFARAQWKAAFKATVPFLAAALLFLIIRGQVIGWEFGDTPRELLNNPFLKIENGQYVDFSTGEKLATITYTLGKYLQLLFVPHPLTHDYYPRHIDIMHWGDWKVLLSLLAYAALIVLAIRGWKKRRVYVFGILFYLITLSIVSNIVFPVGTNMSERFVYMPSLGWALCISGLICGLKKVHWRRTYLVLGVVGLLFAGRTVIRNAVWKDNRTLFLTDIRTSGKSAKLLAAAGGETLAMATEKPEGPERNELARSALEYLTRALAVHPNYKLAYLLMGNAHFYLKQWDQSIAAYEQVLRFDPDNTEAQRNMGLVYRDAGRELGEQDGNIPGAISYLTRAVQILPDDYETVHSLGVAYGLNNQPQQAIEMFKRGVEIAPNNATAHFNLGFAYQQAGDLQNAQKHRDIAVSLDPEVANRGARND